MTPSTIRSRLFRRCTRRRLSRLNGSAGPPRYAGGVSVISVRTPAVAHGHVRTLRSTVRLRTPAARDASSMRTYGWWSRQVWLLGRVQTLRLRLDVLGVEAAGLDERLKGRLHERRRRTPVTRHDRGTARCSSLPRSSSWPFLVRAVYFEVSAFLFVAMLWSRPPGRRSARGGAR